MWTAAIIPGLDLLKRIHLFRLAVFGRTPDHRTMAFQRALVPQTLMVLLAIGTAGDAHDNVATTSPNFNNASDRDANFDMRRTSNFSDLEANAVNSSAIENETRIRLTSYGGASNFYAKVCAGLNCHGSVPLAHVHNFGEALVGQSGGHCVAAFRGTHNLAAAKQDLDSLNLVPWKCSGCRVGAGFVAGYSSLAGQVKSVLRNSGCTSVAVTGHSLGAANAILALYDLATDGFSIVTSYVFGEPRVGNAAFQQAFDSVVHASVFRVVHGQDPIQDLGAAGAVHVGTKIYEPGNSILTDHQHYSGVHMTPCMSDGLPGGAAAEQAAEAAAHAAEQVAEAAAHAVHCCLRMEWSCCNPR